MIILFFKINTKLRWKEQLQSQYFTLLYFGEIFTIPKYIQNILSFKISITIRILKHKESNRRIKPETEDIDSMICTVITNSIFQYRHAGK